MEGKKIRQHAVKLPISTILEATETNDEETNLSYLLVGQQKVFRVNVMGVLVAKERQGTVQRLFLDDGSGKIAAYFFEENAIALQAQVGEVIFLIGRARRYNEERYLSPEIFKILPPLWLKVRALELPQGTGAAVITPKAPQKNDENSLPSVKIRNLIKILDRGEGARVEDVLNQSHLGDTEKWIEKMLQEGEIFQNAPGKIKML